MEYSCTVRRPTYVYTRYRSISQSGGVRRPMGIIFPSNILQSKPSTMSAPWEQDHTHTDTHKQGLQKQLPEKYWAMPSLLECSTISEIKIGICAKKPHQASDVKWAFACELWKANQDTWNCCHGSSCSLKQPLSNNLFWINKILQFKAKTLHVHTTWPYQGLRQLCHITSCCTEEHMAWEGGGAGSVFSLKEKKWDFNTTKQSNWKECFQMSLEVSQRAWWIQDSLAINVQFQEPSVINLSFLQQLLSSEDFLTP